MYLIGINRGTRKRGTRKGLGVNSSAAVNLTPVSILALTIVGLISLLFYFRKGRDINGVPVNTIQKGQTENASAHDSVRHPIQQPEPAKPIPSVTDSGKENNEDSEASPDNSANIETEKIKQQADQAPLIQKKSSAQLLLKLTTNESCKLKIKNIDLDEVIDWDLSSKDNGTIYLKPGSYSIVAMSLTDTTNIKTYHFDVKPGNATTKQNLHIIF